MRMIPSGEEGGMGRLGIDSWMEDETRWISCNWRMGLGICLWWWWGCVMWGRGRNSEVGIQKGVGNQDGWMKGFTKSVIEDTTQEILMVNNVRLNGAEEENVV